MKHFFLYILVLVMAESSYAQQIIKATNVQLVATPGVQLVAAGGITFTGTSSFLQNGRFTLLSNPQAGNADWTDSTSFGVITNPSIGHVLFNSLSAIQQVYGATKFDSVSINGAGINLKQSNEVRRWLGLTNGLAFIQNNNDSIYISNSLVNSVTYNTDSLNTTSWVHGKLSRKTNSNSSYLFPVGKIKSAQPLYAPVRIEKTNNGDATYSIQYFPDAPVNRTATNASIHHISELEYWTITSHNFTSAVDDDANVSLSWRTYSHVSTTAAVRDSLLIAHYFFDGSNWLWQPEFNFSLPNNVNGNINFGFVKSNQSIADFSMPHLNFTLGTRTFANALPVHISRLSANAEGCAVHIKFAALSLSGVEKYEIEWYANNRWTTLAYFSATQAPGAEGLYTAKHLYPATGTNLYRIKLTGIDGKIQYSQVVAARPNCMENNIKVYPVPFTDRFTINGLTGKNTIQLSAMNGQVVFTTNTNQQSADITVQYLPSGSYLLVITSSGGDKKTLKLIKQ